jgi:hypothetical protein
MGNNKHILFVLLFLFSCNNIGQRQNSKETISSKQTNLTVNLKNLLFGNSEQCDSSKNLEKIVFYLNKSKYREAFELLKSGFVLDSLNRGGFIGVKLHNSDYVKDYESYIVYRYNDFFKNVGERELQIDLLRSFFNEDSSLYSLQTLEYDYSRSLTSKDTNNVRNNINNLKIAKSKFPNSLRLDYLLANDYFLMDDSTNALKLFNSLIKKNYYALPSLRNIISYLYSKHNSQLNEYEVQYRKLFPDECNIYELANSGDQYDSLSFLCRKCFSSSFQRDSVFARVFLLRYYLSSNQLQSADSMVNVFLRNIHNEPYENTIEEEEGNFFDVKMRLLFIQHKYSELCEFTKRNLYFNPVINIDNEEQLKVYIKKLYFLYINNDLKNFESFFQQTFGSCYKNQNEKKKHA